MRACIMKRTNFFFPVDLLRKIKSIADREGMSVSEVIRASMRRYIEQDRASLKSQA